MVFVEIWPFLRAKIYMIMQNLISENVGRIVRTATCTVRN